MFQILDGTSDEGWTYPVGFRLSHSDLDKFVNLIGSEDILDTFSAWYQRHCMKRFNKERKIKILILAEGQDLLESLPDNFSGIVYSRDTHHWLVLI